MKNIKIELVTDVNSTYCYLEVFYKKNLNPFLEVGITDDRQLYFKFYADAADVSLNVEDWDYIKSESNDFFPKELKNADDFLTYFGEKI